MIGGVISHYKILEKLGEGGMGVVYKAEDTQLKRMVALKFLPTHLASSEQDKARFMQEAQAAAALSHPNICTIYGIDEHEGQMFFAMEYVDGQTLREKKDTLGFKQAIDTGIQIAEGLAAAHEKGIVHRDIKPENIMIRKDGRVQVMDFGLAKLRSSGSKITRLTKEGSTVGTAGYMSPEQVQGQEADHRSDIFSFGVLLYELLTGQLPFKGVHETALAYEIVNVDAVPMANLRSNIDPSLDAIVLECLEKDMNERSQSMRQIAVDLRRYKRESSRQRVSRVTGTRPALQAPQGEPSAHVSSGTVQASSGSMGVFPEHVQPRRSTMTSFLTASGFLLSIVLLLLWHPWSERSTGATEVMRSVIALPEGDEIAFNYSGSSVEISPDGRLIAYYVLNRDSGVNGLYVRSLDSYRSKLIPGVFPTVIKFSSDGRWIYYTSGGELRKISVDGGAPIRLLTVSQEPKGMDWGPDGSLYLSASALGGLERIPPGADSAEIVTTPDEAKGEISHRYPSVLPDGKAILLTVKYKTTKTFDDANIIVHDLETGKNTTLIEGGSDARYVPTGHIVYVRGGSFFVAPFDPGARKLTGPTRQLFAGGMVMPSSGNACYAFSKNGTLVYAPGGPSRINDGVVDWLSPEGKTTPLVTTPAEISSISLSPDGSKLALQINAANNDIWTYDIRQSARRRLTFGGGNNQRAIWTPDGNRIIYKAEKNGKIELYWCPSDGSGKEELLVAGEKGVDLVPGACTPDGKHMLYYHLANNKQDVWEVSLDGERKTRPVLQTRFDESDLRISPNGRWLAYFSTESGTRELYVVPYPSGEGKWQITSGYTNDAYWNRDGTEILYIGDTTFYAVPLKGSSSIELGPRRVVAHLGKLDFGIRSAIFDPINMRWAVVHASPDAKSPDRINIVTGWFDELRSKGAHDNK